MKLPDTVDNARISELVLNTDYYVENGLVVFTAEYLRTRGWCCGNGCRHCPYEQNAPQESRKDSL